jgi:hypothetical protein
MAGASLNREYTVVGDTIELDITIKDDTDFVKDADSNPSYIIYTPQLSVFHTGVSQKVDTGYYIASVKIPKDAEVSDNWKIAWTYSLKGKRLDFEELFQVKSDVETDQSLSVSIDDHTLTRIKAIIGSPFIDEELTLNDEQIKSYCLIPAFEVFFSKFPLYQIDQFSIVGEGSWDFPTDNTFGVLDCRTVNKVEGQTTGGGSNFWSLYVHSRTFGKNTWNRSSYGTGYNYNGLNDQWDMKLQALETMNNRLGTFKYRVDYENRKLIAYSSINCMLAIKWAKYSYNIKNVKFTLRPFYIKLAQWYLLSHLVDTASLATEDENTTSRIDVDKLQTKADKLKEDIDKMIETYPDVILLRAG